MVVSCNLCNTTDVDVLLVRDSWRIVRCRQCNLVYVNPPPTAEQLEKLYGNFFSEPSPSEIRKKRELIYPYFEQAAQKIQSQVRSGKLLDIGCGIGLFLEVMQKRGWEASGIEPSKDMAAYAPKAGLNIFFGTLTDYDCPPGYFDVVTMWYVFEHLLDPYRALCKINRMLKHDGLMVIRIPNLNFMKPFMSIEKSLGIIVRGVTGIDPPRHLYYFSPHTVSAMLEKCGFSVGSIEHGKPAPLKSMSKGIVKSFTTISAELIRLLTGGRLILGPAIAVYARKSRDVESNNVMPF